MEVHIRDAHKTEPASFRSNTLSESYECTRCNSQEEFTSEMNIIEHMNRHGIIQLEDYLNNVYNVPIICT